MKVGVYADAHFSLNSSVVLGNKNSLDGRLTYLIETFKWMYETFREKSVETIIDLGDLSDSYNLRAEEITAISRALSFNEDIPEVHILGNHERLSKAGDINSVEFLENIPNHRLIKDVTQEKLGGQLVTYIPYAIYEDGCFDSLENTRLAFSHIDIFGADTGGWSLKSGLSPVYLTKHFELVLNGHIHNGSWVIKNKIINIGAISGQNFASKAIHWEPSIAIVDTDTLELELIENPYALRFYSETVDSVSKVMELMNSLDGERNVIQVKVPLSISNDVRSILDNNKGVLASRVNVIPEVSEESGIDVDLEQIEKLNSVEGGFKKLVEFINEKEDLPQDRKLVLQVISELEQNNLVV